MIDCTLSKNEMSISGAGSLSASSAASEKMRSIFGGHFVAFIKACTV